MSGVSVADSSDVVISVQILGVWVELQMFLSEFETSVAEDHGLDDAVGAGLDQLAAALKREKKDT